MKIEIEEFPLFDLKTHLRTLSEAHAPSGYEAPIRAILREDWAPFVDEFEQHKLGNLIGIKRATQPLEKPRKIMLAAHMDEIGLMVRVIVDGFLYLHRIRGVDNRLMLAQQVIVHGKKPLPGVVAATPPHLLDAAERKKYPTFDMLVVDTGLPADEVEELVQIGDLVTPDAPMMELQGNLVAGKAMDDRACIAAISVCLQHLQTAHHSWDVYAAATVQEENGYQGAQTAAYAIQPDIAIALDVGFAEQPGVSGDDAFPMGEGASIALGANIHPKLFDKIIEVADAFEIKYHVEPIPARTGTDALAIQVARDGVPTALLSIPLRNMHSPIETINLRDIERTGRLLAHFIAALDADFMQAISWDEMTADA